MDMVKCKRCHGSAIVKNGFVRTKQRYRCAGCGYNFIEGDGRVNPSLPTKKALAVLLYALGKGRFTMLARVLGVSKSLAYRWIAQESEKIPQPAASASIEELEFAEMWHFIQSKKTKNSSAKRWIVFQGELWPGCPAIVALQPSNGSGPK